MDLGPLGGGDNRRRGRAVYVYLYTPLRMDLVSLALGVGPLSLRRLGRAPLASSRLALRLGGAPSRRGAFGASPPLSRSEFVDQRRAKAELGLDLTLEEVTSIVSWLNSLTGEIPQGYIARPDLPDMPGAVSLKSHN